MEDRSYLMYSVQNNIVHESNRTEEQRIPFF